MSALPLTAGGMNAAASQARTPTSWTTRLWMGLAFVFATAAAATAMDTMPLAARFALVVFATAIVAWTIWRLPETPVALVAGVALIACGASTPQQFYATLGDDLIWLLIGAFILAAVLSQSGVAQREALRAAAGASSLQRLCYRLTWVIIATAFVVPSTSGRAALLLPVFLALAGVIGKPRAVRALALLFPTVILLSACASLLGAGAHLIAVDFIARIGAPTFSHLGWAWLGAPFAIVSSLAATALILRLFLTAEERAGAVALPRAPVAPLKRTQRNVLLITAATVALWMTSTWHGVEPALVALIGAVAATASSLTGVSMKQAIKQVEWNLVLFLAATLLMGEALVTTGAAPWVAAQALAALPAAVTQHGWLLVTVATLVALLSHLVITSRSARALVLIPTVALPLALGEINPAALIFLTVVASGFCQTFAVSAKPVALFAQQERPTYSDADLLRLALWLLPVLVLLLLVFAFAVWPLQGLMLFDPLAKVPL